MKRAQSPRQAVKSGQFRIIAGLWRSRRLTFPAIEGLRPTPDRVKETLFNWLSPEIRQANCLDLYAGSGCLGLEALSRGAAHCWFMEQNALACQAIEAHIDTLKARARVQQAVLPEALASVNSVFNLVFLDPPYARESHDACLHYLIKQGCLADNALVYCENASQHPLPVLTGNFELYRHKTAGAVQYALLRYKAASSAAPNSL